MEKKMLPCPTVGLVFVALALVAVFVWQMPDNGKSGDWAAWVQAFGSIAAIAGTAAIARAEYRRTLRTERRQIQRDRRMVREQRRLRVNLELTKVDAVVHLCEGVLMAVDQCLNDPRATSSAVAFLKYCEAAEARAKICIEQIEQVPMYEVPYSYLAQELINLRTLEKDVLPALLRVARALRAKASTQWPHPAVLAVKTIYGPVVMRHRAKLDSERRNAVLRLEALG